MPSYSGAPHCITGGLEGKDWVLGKVAFHVIDRAEKLAVIGVD